jgi:hypothetical protein
MTTEATMRTHLASFILCVGLIFTGSAAEAQSRLITPRVNLRVRSPYLPSVQRVRTVSRAPSIRRLPAPRPEPAQPGSMSCRVQENGVEARASFVLLRGGQTVATGDCARAPIEVPAGTYEAVLTLETAIDRPQRTVRLTVPSGGRARATASFSTSILEVRFTNDRAPVHGMAIIRRDGRTVATLGSRVSARISSGTYEIVARYRTEERTYTVTLAPGQRRALRASF